MATASRGTGGGSRFDINGPLSPPVSATCRCAGRRAPRIRVPSMSVVPFAPLTRLTLRGTVENGRIVLRQGWQSGRHQSQRCGAPPDTQTARLRRVPRGTLATGSQRCRQARGRRRPAHRGRCNRASRSRISPRPAAPDVAARRPMPQGDERRGADARRANCVHQTGDERFEALRVASSPAGILGHRFLRAHLDRALFWRGRFGTLAEGII